MPILASVDHLVLTVENIERSVEFYCGVLGAEEITFGEGRKAVRIGQQKINLHLKGAEISPHAQRPTPGSADLCFLSTVLVEALMRHLGAHGVEVELGPVPRTGAVTKLMSVYVRNPDGNLVEIANRLPEAV